jgi:S-DNA-T family DNA segregation ATPase FtsK/SpoIIIE
MARRKKRSNTSTNRTRRKKGAIVFNVPKSILREIYGVFYLGLGVFTVLSLNNSFGIIGDMWVSFLKPILGWGIYGFPFMLILISLMYFLSKRINFPLSRILGVGFMMIAILSILHLSVPMGNIYTVAKAGEYGGFIGFMMNFLFLEMLQMGSVGATAVFLVILLTGVLLTFQLSLLAILKLFKPSFPHIQINQVDDLKGRRAGKMMDIVDEFDSDAIIKKIDRMPDEDFTMPDMATLPAESTLQIRRASISNVKTEDGRTLKVDQDGVIQESSEDNQVKSSRQIVIKNESAEALTSKSTDADRNWEPPHLDLLSPAVPDIATDDELLADNARKIKAKLNQFGIDVTMHEVHVGPTVIQYTLKPSEGIKLSKITTLKNDLALALAATAIRIEAPIPGKGLVGIEVPNEHRSIVHLREIMESKEYKENRSNLRFPLGRDVAGKPMCADLSAMPHLLIAGATGSGKSVGMNAFLLSLLYQNSPSDLRLILIDPKQVELKTYNGLPHLLTPVINDPEKAAIALRWCVAEMNRRYRLLSDHGVRNIHEYNEVVVEKQAAAALHVEDEGGAFQEAVTKAHQDVATEDAVEEGGTFLTMPEVKEQFDEVPQKMPNIVLIIDELADLMMSAGKEVEASICRIAQMARAVGMHLVLATQRPSVDVITGLIKANVPARIAFAVSSQIDSRTIIDGVGAEDLLGKGDMLYLSGGTSKLVRIQGIYVSTKEIERVVNNVKLHGEPMYEDIISPKIASEKVQGLPKSDFGDEEVGDDMYENALNVVIESRKASASLLQRRLKVGYARAARLLDMMEEKGAIGPVNGAKAREIYLD